MLMLEDEDGSFARDTTDRAMHKTIGDGVADNHDFLFSETPDYFD
jgi:hypothetical protein